MAKKRNWLTLLALLPLTLVIGAGEGGKVIQGRVIALDKTKGTVTIIKDAKADKDKPEYALPPVTFTLPATPGDMDPEPKAGKRIKLDVKAKQIIIFDTASQNFKTLDYTLVDQKEGVDKEDPLVAGKKFPVVDQEKKAITVYSPRQKILTAFSLPAEYLALPPDTWDNGDEVTITYQEEGKAKKITNLSKPKK
jgi:hypothetical protein